MLSWLDDARIAVLVITIMISTTDRNYVRVTVLGTDAVEMSRMKKSELRSEIEAVVKLQAELEKRRIELGHLKFAAERRESDLRSVLHSKVFAL
jgi:hypothetical protein